MKVPTKAITVLDMMRLGHWMLRNSPSQACKIMKDNPIDPDLQLYCRKLQWPMLVLAPNYSDETFVASKGIPPAQDLENGSCDGSADKSQGPNDQEQNCKTGGSKASNSRFEDDSRESPNFKTDTCRDSNDLFEGERGEGQHLKRRKIARGTVGGVEEMSSLTQREQRGLERNLDLKHTHSNRKGPGLLDYLKGVSLGARSKAKGPAAR